MSIKTLRARRALLALSALTMVGILPVATADAAILNSDLEAVPVLVDPVPPGGSSLLNLVVVNLGPAATTAPFTMTVNLPAGTTAEGPFVPETCRVVPLSQDRRVRCTFPAGLAAFRSTTAVIPFNVAPNVESPSVLRGSFRVTAPLDDLRLANNQATFEIEVS
ncbi:hypothetical protein [Streptomyces erythrochromogenes]|uniref:hypothetical protein n=1 Tax=Streptomyces erythrochromogenes TaxID=285574 RepID=UPI0036FF322C